MVSGQVAVHVPTRIAFGILQASALLSLAKGGGGRSPGNPIGPGGLFLSIEQLNCNRAYRGSRVSR